MSAPVWVLSVDLQAKTATFQSGLADAAKAARGSFGDVKSSAADMGAGVSGSVTNVRAALGLFDNSIRGNHAAAMADLIREFSHTSIVMAALPFAAVAGGFVFLGSLVIGAAEKIKEFREEQEKIGQDQTKLSTAVNTVWGSLDDKLLTAEQAPMSFVTITWAHYKKSFNSSITRASAS